MPTKKKNVAVDNTATILNLVNADKDYLVVDVGCRFVIKVPLGFSEQDALREAQRILKEYAEILPLTIMSQSLPSFECNTPGLRVAG